MTIITPCIPWTGALHVKGYGLVYEDGKRTVAHRVAYQTHHSTSLPDDLLVDHLCHNADLECRGGNGCRHRRCVNPDHLEAVTPGGEQPPRGRVNATKTHCKNGHAFDAANTYLTKRGTRECRACNAARYRARKARLAAMA